MRTFARMASLVVLMTCSSFVASAQFSAQAAAWVDGPVRYLLGDEERAAYLALEDDAAAESWQGLFWARRDSDPITRINETKLDFEARVTATEQFSTEAEVGVDSDRGQVLLVLGAPNRRGEENIEAFLAKIFPEEFQSGTARSVRGLIFDRSKGRADVWIYGREQLPEGNEIPSRFDEVMFVFFDAKGTGVYALDHTVLPDARWGLQALEEAPALQVVSAELSEIPVYPLIAGTDAAAADMLAALDGSQAAEGGAAMISRGFSSEQTPMIWLALATSLDSPMAQSLVGRMTVDGRVEGSFSVPTEGLESLGQRVYMLSLPEIAGEESLDVGLVAGGELIGSFHIDVELEELGEGLYISPLVAGGRVDQLEAETFGAGDPFVYGGYRIVPAVGKVSYTIDDTVSYFCYAIDNAGSGDEQLRTVSMKRKIYFNKQPASQPQTEDVQMTPVMPNVFIWGSDLALGVVKRAGDWKLKIELKDTATQAERASEVHMALAVSE